MTVPTLTQQASPSSIFDVARLATAPPPRPASTAPLHRIFSITSGRAAATVGPQLGAKFGLERDNQQPVVCVTNKWTLEQVWWNEARTKKPQTFVSQIAGADAWRLVDPTNNGKACDFCNWDTFTAEDPGFGRVENEHAVTASNLFKYAEPCHGLVLYKHHDPLAFSLEQLSALLDVAEQWFRQSASAQAAAGSSSSQARSSSSGAAGPPEEPFLLWNCLPRAGASQFHGHAQVTLTHDPFPQQQRLRLAAAHYAQHFKQQQQQQPSTARLDHQFDSSYCYYADLLRAHEALGLLHACSTFGQSTTAGHSVAAGNGTIGATAATAAAAAAAAVAGGGADTAWGFALITPTKDMEVVVVGSHMGSPAFTRMLHAAMRALIDRLGVRTFNVGMLNLRETLDLYPDSHHHSGASTGGEEAYMKQDNGSSTGMGDHLPDGLLIGRSGTSNGGGGTGKGSSNSGGGSSTSNSTSSNSTTRSTSKSAAQIPDRFMRPPLLVRVVSRGKVGAPASDYGGLEVFGGASIGHTDPYVVAAALQEQIACYT